MKTTISSYLFSRIREAGADCTFGIPGDFALPLYAAQAQLGLRTVVCSHEPGAAFAADAYARMKGLGVVLTTYGAGALNLINPVAMSFAEFVRVLVVSGAPETFKRGNDRRGSTYFHHVVRNLDSQSRMFKEVTAEQASLSNPATAGKFIDGVFYKMFLRSRPGYIELPRDMTFVEIDEPKKSLRDSFPVIDIDSEAMERATDELLHRLENSQRPVFWIGVLSSRYRLMPQIIEIAEMTGVPVVSSVMGKTAFPELHPQYMGTYMASVGEKAPQEALENCDFALAFGVISSDSNFGLSPHLNLHRTKIVNLNQRDIMAGFHRYDNLPLMDVVEVLHKKVKDRAKAGRYKNPVWKMGRRNHAAASVPKPSKVKGPLLMQDLITALKSLPQEKYTFISDIGESWFVGLELTMTSFLCSADYATMGYAVPAAIGAGIGDKKRPFVIVGDGAFQMTGTEIATLVDEGVPAIVLLINNSNYNMLSAFDGDRPYFARRTWDYEAFVKAMGAEAVRVQSKDEFDAALNRAIKQSKTFVIEAIIDKNDSAPIVLRLKDRFKGVRLSDMFLPKDAVAGNGKGKTAAKSSSKPKPKPKVLSKIKTKAARKGGR